MTGSTRHCLDAQHGSTVDAELRSPHHHERHNYRSSGNRHSRYEFVTDGIQSALAQTRAAAGDKNVTVMGGAKTAQQCVRAGLLDEIDIHLVPVLLGDGTRLFDHLGTEPIELERLRVIESPG